MSVCEGKGQGKCAHSLECTCERRDEYANLICTAGNKSRDNETVRQVPLQMTEVPDRHSI